MAKVIDAFAKLNAHMDAGRRLAAETDVDAYEWQCRVGDWYCAVDPLVEDALPGTLCADYLWERKFVAPVAVEERFLHMLKWLENALAAQPARVAPVHEMKGVCATTQSTTAEPIDFHDIPSWFEASSLTVPPLPSSLADSVRRQQRFVFSSREVTVNPYAFSWYLDEALGREVDDYVLVAHSGHGANSYGLSYYLVWSGVRLLFQLHYGGFYMDKQKARLGICKTFDALHRLWPALSARVAMSPPLVIAHSDFYGGCLARVGESVSERWRAACLEHALERVRQELGSSAYF